MKNKWILLLLLFIVTFRMQAQFTLAAGNNILQVSGNLSSYYNYRFYHTGNTDFSKNRFVMDDAQLKLTGRYASHVKYTLQFDFADLISGQSDPENDPLMDANAEYITPVISVKCGYQKLPYSVTQIVSSTQSPFLQRAEMCRGDAIPMRDLGFTLSHNFFYNRIILYAGAYTGMGAASMLNSNDFSGKLLYVGRVQFSYPSKYEEQLVDMNQSDVPLFQAAFNYMYQDKKISSGADYNMLTLDGKKETLGGNACFFYKGFSLVVENNYIRAVPNDISRLTYGTTVYNRFNAGGWLYQATYYSRRLSSLFSVRYDDFNPSDLTPSDTRRQLSFAYNYLIPGTSARIKVQYIHRLPFTPEATYGWKEDDLRGGLQWLF